MAPLKTGVSRALRSKVSNGGPRLWSGVNRGIAATTKDANSMNSITPITTSIFPPPLQAPSNNCHDTKPLTSLISNSPALHNRLPSPATFPALSASKTTTFDDLLNNLTKTLSTPNGTSPLPQLHNLMRTYKSNSMHWSKFAHQNPNKQYTRNLVCEVPGIFNLLILVWTPGKRSPVHDHADAHCLMKVLQGSLQEDRYAIPTNPGFQGPLVKTSQLGFGLNKVSYMADALGLHSISNPSPTDYAVSLHLYFPPNAALRGSTIYDPETGDAKLVMGGYDSVSGVVV